MKLLVSDYIYIYICIYVDLLTGKTHFEVNGVKK